jgi:hypothetical protein
MCGPKIGSAHSTIDVTATRITTITLSGQSHLTCCQSRFHRIFVAAFGLTVMNSSASSVDATNSVPSTSTAFSTESYFQSQKPPPNLEDKCSRIQAFVDRWFNVSTKRVVLVTVSSRSTSFDCLRHPLPANVMADGQQSGGTTVPLESNT